MRKLVNALALVLMVGLLTSACDVAKQINQLATLARCQYKMSGVSGITLAGVDFRNKTSVTDITLVEGATLGLAYAQGNFPLTMNVNVDVKNTQTTEAALTQMDYIMTLEGNPLTTGTLPKNFTVPAGTTGTLPIPVSVNLISALSGKSQTDMLNLVLNLVGQSSKPSNLGLRIRPYFNVAGTTLQFPHYFTVTTELGGDSL